MKNIPNEKKIRILIIAICVVLFIIIVLFVLRLLLKRGIIGNSSVNSKDRLSGVYISSDEDFETENLSAEKCNEDGEICIEGIEIIPKGNSGLITYTVRNNSSTAKSGVLSVTIGTQKFVFPYNNVPPFDEATLAEKKEIFGYDNIDIQLNDFEVEDAHDDDLSLMYESMSTTERESIDVN